jgi:hypothetical protein
MPASNVGSNGKALYRLNKADIETFMVARKSGAIHTPRKKVKATLPQSPHFSAKQLERMAKMQGQ